MMYHDYGLPLCEVNPCEGEHRDQGFATTLPGLSTGIPKELNEESICQTQFALISASGV